MSAPLYDMVIKDVRVVRPHGNVVHEGDVAIRDGKFARIAPGIDAAQAKEVHDGRGLLAFPGVVDAHMHSGIYSLSTCSRSRVTAPPASGAGSCQFRPTSPTSRP